MNEFWATLGLAALISLGVSGLVTLWSGYRTGYQHAVIEDRRRWRDDIRALMPKLVDPQQIQVRQVTRNEIMLRLNPVEDREAMQLVDAFVNDPSIDGAERVVEHFQTYLKFEWTRAKKEAGWWPFRAAKRARREIKKQERAARIQPERDS